jgi:hypothetical protein
MREPLLASALAALFAHHRIAFVARAAIGARPRVTEGRKQFGGAGCLRGIDTRVSLLSVCSLVVMTKLRFCSLVGKGKKAPTRDIDPPIRSPH